MYPTEYSSVRRRAALHDLLVTPLDRTVAFEEVHRIAMRIAENLAFDVAGTRAASAPIFLAKSISD